MRLAFGQRLRVASEQFEASKLHSRHQQVFCAGWQAGYAHMAQEADRELDALNAERNDRIETLERCLRQCWNALLTCEHQSVMIEERDTHQTYRNFYKHDHDSTTAALQAAETLLPPETQPT